MKRCSCYSSRLLLYKLQLSRSCGARGENLPCSLTQANSSLTLENAFIGEHDVGEADNKLKENEDDTTENDFDDDVDIPWSVEQSDREDTIKDQMRLNHKLQLTLEMTDI